MSLLTPSESHLLQSFLTSVDAQDFELEWNMQLDVPQNHNPAPPQTSNNPLVKATKDLMALDGVDKFRYQPAHRLTEPLREAAAPATRQPQQPPNPLSFLYSTRRTQCMPDQGPSYKRSSSSSSGYSPLDAPVSSSSSPSDTPTPTPTTSTKRASPVDSRPSKKRARQDGSSLSSKARASEPSSSASSSHAASSSMSTSTVTAKTATLLSPSQKKANHIQSEQKRRANIRRGYEALCETVPTLREAIQAEEDESAKAAKGKRRSRGKAAAAAVAAEDSEKIDGRAGPRSENVVLSKTIEYITDLLGEQESLLKRLHTARSALPQNHFLLLPHTSGEVPLWERKWTGGENKDEEEEDEEEDE